MLSHHPGKYGDDRHCGSGDIILLVAERKDSPVFNLNSPLLLISKAHSMPCSNKNQDLPVLPEIM